MTQYNMTSLALPRSLKEFRPVAAAAPNPPTLRRKASVIVSVDAEDADAKPAEQHPCKRRAVMKVKTSRFERVLDDDEQQGNTPRRAGALSFFCTSRFCFVLLCLGSLCMRSCMCIDFIPTVLLKTT